MTTTPPPVNDPINYRFLMIEKDIRDLQTQIQTYVPMREHELQLRMIRESVDRIERQVLDLGNQISLQQQKGEQQKSEQDKLIIRLQFYIITTIIGLIITIISGIVVNFINHLPT